MRFGVPLFLLLLAVWAFGIGFSPFSRVPPVGEQGLLNVSYDPTRELYKDYNQLFAAHWKTQTGRDIAINQSHGGSGTVGPVGDRER